MTARPLSKEMFDDLEAKRSWVRNHYTENVYEQYETLEGKINLLSAILENNWIQKDETLKLQCLGITLGDAFIQYFPEVKWVEYSDEYGTDPALQYKNTDFFIFPQTMISKRVEDGIEININELLEGLYKYVTEKTKSN